MLTNSLQEAHRQAFSLCAQQEEAMKEDLRFKFQAPRNGITGIENKRLRLGLAAGVAILAVAAFLLSVPLFAGIPQPANGYKVQPAITR
jgi:hypothetical protein